MATFWRCEGIAGGSEHPMRLVRQGESCPRCGKNEVGEVPMREPGKEISAFDLINRFKFHPATAETGPKHEAVREACLALGETLQELVPPGRELSTAITKLEETMMWANAGIARIPGEGA